MVEGFLLLLQVAGILAASAFILVAALRPEWAHIYYDALLWRSAIADTTEWVSDKTKTEMFVLIGAFVAGFVAGGPSLWASVGSGLSASISALLIGALLLFVWSYVNASWKVLEKARTEPYNGEVPFAALVDGAVVYLMMRNRLKSGAFSAHLTDIKGASLQEQWSGSKAFPWRDVAGAKRDIENGDDQAIKLIRFETKLENDSPRLKVFMYEYTDREVERPLVYSGTGYGNYLFDGSPLELHLNVKDSMNVERPVVVWMSAKATRAAQPAVRAHLLREF